MTWLFCCTASVARNGVSRPLPPRTARWPQELGGALLVAEDLAGVEAGGAARGEERGGAGDGSEKRRGGGEGERVGGLDAEEDGLHRTSAGQRGGETDREAERDEEERIAQDHPHHLRARGAERDPQADFAGAPRGPVGHHSVESDGRQDERQGAEESAQRGQHALLENGLVDLLAEGAYVADGDVRPQAAQLAVDRQIGRAHV